MEHYKFSLVPLLFRTLELDWLTAVYRYAILRPCVCLVS